MISIGSIKKTYIEKYSRYLADEGQKLINLAFSNAEFDKNKTQNLHDSYGSCVFYDGKEVFNTRRYVGRKALIGKKDPQGNLVLGRAEIDSFFDGYKPRTKGFELVLAAAIFYAEILEKQKGNLKRKYRVITSIDAQVDALANKLNARVRNINL